MKSKRMRFLTVLLATTMVLTTALVGCKSKTASTTTPAANGSGDTNTASKTKTPPATPQFNKEKVIRRTEGWPKPPLYQGNNFGSGGTGPSAYFFEGLYRFVRSTDKIYDALAEGWNDEGNVTTIPIRKNAKWQDGEDFTSKDVWAYFVLNNGCEVTKYFKSIEMPDDKTVKITWQDPAPFSDMKKYLVAQETVGTVPYHIYKQYVDKAWELLQKGKPAAKVEDRRAFGLTWDDSVSKEFDANWQAFIKSGPKMPIGTGPFVVKTVTATDMILEKFKDYWAADKVYFDKFWCKQVPELSSQYAMLKAGQLDFYDGTQPRDILEGLLNGNKDLLHYRMYDPACVSIQYNIRKTPFDDLKVRQALTYIIDKTKVREVGNYYGGENKKISAVGIPDSDSDKYFTDDVKSKLTDYTTNPDKAAQLLQEAGWTKGSDGTWKMKDGKTPDFTIGAPAGWFPAINSGQVVAEQWTKFGIPTKLKAVDGSVYYTNADKGEYDVSMDWADVSWSFSEPWNALRNSYWWGPKTKIGFPTVHKKDKDGKDVDTGQLNLIVKGPNGEDVDVDKTLKAYVYENDPAKRKEMVNQLMYAYNENCWVVSLFQNTTGTWWNMKMIDANWPMADQIEKYNRDMPNATDPEDQERIADTNIGFGGEVIFFTGQYWPR